MSERLDWGDGPLFLGFDLSTQSCKALVMDHGLGVRGMSRVNYDADLPHFKTVDGCHRGEGGRVTSPTKMWVEAMELVLDRLKEQGCPFGRVSAVSGSAQQHASVYWSATAAGALKSLDASKGSLVEQLSEAFATEDSPIWMDTSTATSCKELAELAGGPLQVAALTGSLAQERFSGHFIRRFVAEHGLDGLGGVSLASSFGASLLAGEVLAIDRSDAAGMHLMDIRSQCWLESLLEFTAPGQVEGLRRVLAEPQDSWNICSRVHPFWVQRYGFSEECSVVAWSGDNPCAVVGNGLVREGDISISLGSSDVAIAVIPSVPQEPLPMGHLFPHPILDGCYWGMLCYTNGDVTRRKVRDEFFSGTPGEEWSAFSKALKETSPGNDGAVGMFFTMDEITPAISNGPDLRGRADPLKEEVALEALTAFEDMARNVRAVIEMRALAIRNHLQRLMPGLLEAGVDGNEEGPQLLLTGGASANQEILQVFADVFQRPVRCMDTTEGAAFGAAVRALHASDAGGAGSVSRLAVGLRVLGSVRARPAADAGVAAAYDRAAKAYAAMEASAMSERGRQL